MHKKTYLTLASLLIFCFSTLTAHAERVRRSSVELPTHNPHPPISAMDKKRVAFAEETIKLLIKEVFTQPQKNDISQWLKKKNLTFDLNLECIQSRECWTKKNDVAQYVQAIQQELWIPEEVKFAHVVPWSMSRYKKTPDSTTDEKKPTEGATNIYTKPPLNMPHPNLAKNEYMVHAYAKFLKEWYDLDVILTEDKDGNILFRRFYIGIIPEENKDIVPMTRC